MNKLSEMIDDNTKAKLEQMSDAEIIETLEIPFKPIDDRILVKPLDEIKIRKTIVVPDEEKNEGKDPIRDELETKEVEDDVISNLRVGVILAISEGNEKFKVGEKIVYIHKAAMPFDIYRDSVLIRRYDVLGYWLN